MKNMKCRNNGNTEVGYLSKPEGTIDMGTKWATKRDKQLLVYKAGTTNDARLHVI